MKGRDIIEMTTHSNECRSFRKGASAFFFVCFLAVGMLSSVEASAQMFDSISHAFCKKPRLIGGFATKTTFIDGFRSPIFTARVGLEFNKTVRVGAGISWLQLSPPRAGKDNTPFYIAETFSDASGAHTVYPALEFRYANVFFEYVYYRSGKWQFSVPLQIGAGGSEYKYNYNGENKVQDRHWILLYEPAVSGQYKIVKWFGVGLDVGLRVMAVTNKNIGYKFNSPVYDIKAIIFWGELYRMVFPK
jgi:hypothetical protein